MSVGHVDSQEVSADKASADLVKEDFNKTQMTVQADVHVACDLTNTQTEGNM